VLEAILKELLGSVPGASAAIFLDGDGEAIAHAGDTIRDIRLQGAWKEIHLDRIKEITNRLGLGNVQAVLFSLEEGNELMAPVDNDYCLVLFLSSYTDVRTAMSGLMKAVKRIKEDIA
jgi:predicted regulator of Ras-like GTPase activity (Roadblock/LC7/MglB family)